MWNLSMKDPLPRGNAQRSGLFNQSAMNSSGNPQVNKGSFSNNAGYSTKKGKPDYCWNFNKGIKCKYGRSCRFIERCSYCDSPAHRVVSCTKLEKKDFNLGKGGKNGRGRSPLSNGGGERAAQKNKED